MQKEEVLYFIIHHSSFKPCFVPHILRKHGYPPDLEEEATKTVLAQAELLCAEWRRSRADG
jgi:hypothetical protein